MLDARVIIRAPLRSVRRVFPTFFISAEMCPWNIETSFESTAAEQSIRSYVECMPLGWA